MTSDRATVMVQARERRRPDVNQDTSTPPVLSAAGRTSCDSASVPWPATKPVARAGADRTLLEVAQRYLAPALKAAAAARARTAQIRAASVAAADAARPAPREYWAGWAQDLPSALTLPPMPTEDPRMDETMASWTIHGPSTADGGNSRPARPSGPAVPANRGLSVAEAARASRIRFRPLQPETSARPAAPASSPRAVGAPIPTAAGKPAAPADTAPWSSSAAPATAGPAAPPPAPSEADELAPTAAGQPVTRPGISGPPPEETARRVAPERIARQRRFEKTLADLQRHQAATRPDEPWGKVVPRPAVPQSNPANSESRWSRLWSRR
jgi:hypothetical protein